MGENPRPRIKKKIEDDSHVHDPEAYLPNCTTDRAKLIKSFKDAIDAHFYIDLHYTKRDYFGDDDGPRDGIGIEYVEPLVLKSFRHLLYYSLKHKGFVFINHPPPKHRAIRVVLKDILAGEEVLNIIVEYQYRDINTYEVTVITAMRKEEFHFGEGDYALEFEGNYSSLIFKQGGKYNILDNYTC